MRVQRVLVPGLVGESWTVLGDDLVPVEPVERFLAYLVSVERSPNTVKAYAHDLKDFFTYLVKRDLDWRAVNFEDIARFVAWLRSPPDVRDGRTTVSQSTDCHYAESSVNRKLSSITSFYEFHSRRGVDVTVFLTAMRPSGSRRGSVSSYKTFLDHIAKHKPQRQRTIKIKVPNFRPRVLTAEQAQAILNACEHLRDRFLFALMLDTGVRVGEALGLRHEDLAVAERQVMIVPRANDNRMRVKSGRPRVIPTSSGLMRLYADYLIREYGSLDSDYVFVNLWAEPLGHPWSYPAVYALVQRLRDRTGVDFEPHQFRHTYATSLLRQGAGIETVRELLGHSSISTTLDTYGHLSVEDVRKTLEVAGWFTDQESRP